MTTTATHATHAKLRSWAKGSHPLEAAVELLIRSFRGRFATTAYPWVIADETRAAIDGYQIDPASTAALSSGERRVLQIVAALVGERRIDLGDALQLDRAVLELVIAAFGHASSAGHAHDTIRHDDSTHLPVLVPMPDLYRWPEPN